MLSLQAIINAWIFGLLGVLCSPTRLGAVLMALAVLFGVAATIISVVDEKARWARWTLVGIWLLAAVAFRAWYSFPGLGWLMLAYMIAGLAGACLLPLGRLAPVPGAPR